MTDETNNVVGEALASNYMLASLTVRNWQATKTDRQASRDLTDSKNASEDAARVVKKLLVGAEKELKEVQSAYTAIRTYFYEHSLPWTVTTSGALKGDRLIAVIESMAFLARFATLKQQADALLKDFVANHYEPAKQAAKVHAGGLWKEDEYPSGAQVLDMFGAHLSLRPMPSVQDFDRLAIPGKLAAGLKGIYERHMEAQIGNAMADLQQRVVSELVRFKVQMDKVVREEKTRLYDSLHTNLTHLAKMCRTLNLRELDSLSRLATAIDLMCKGEVSGYKGNVVLARAAYYEAERLLEQAKHPETFGLVGEDVEPDETPATNDTASGEADNANDEPPDEPRADIGDEEDVLDKEVSELVAGEAARATDFDIDEVFY